MYEYKYATTHEEKIKFQSKMWCFLDKLNATYGEKIKDDIKPVIDNKKKYKHEYYMRNKHKYIKRKD
jgi:hypothetical protein